MKNTSLKSMIYNLMVQGKVDREFYNAFCTKLKGHDRKLIQQTIDTLNKSKGE